MGCQLNVELLVSIPVLNAVKEYKINIPEVCIKAILTEIERHYSITSAVTSTSASRELEIRELREELRLMRQKLELAEAAVAPKRMLWHRK
jgi:hypothetical protein